MELSISRGNGIQQGKCKFIEKLGPTFKRFYSCMIPKRLIKGQLVNVDYYMEGHII